jgi:two-component system, response regulator PdtaR
MSGTALATVLTVEDDPLVRADLRLVLEDAGFEVCAAARDGIEAVELAREHEPDVILLDLGLPRLDGAEAARRIRSERDVPIVALTGHRDGDLRRRAVEAGAVSIVTKPFVETAVVQALHDALGERLDDERLESRRAIEELLELSGYLPEIAGELEARCYAQGRRWRIVERRKR